MKMVRILEYTIISHTCFGRVHDEVNDRLKQDWQPYGDLKVTQLKEETILYTQAMVKYPELWPDL